MIVRMAKVRLLGERARLDEAILVLQDVGLLHLAPPPTVAAMRPATGSGREGRRTRQLQRILADVDACRAALARPATPGALPASSGPPPLLTWAREVRRLRRRLDALASRRAALDEERALVARYQRFFGAFAALEAARHRLADVSAYHVVLRADQAGQVDRLRDALRAAAADQFELLAEPLPGGETALLVLVPAALAARIDRLLQQARVQEVPLPAGYGSTLAEAVPRMLQRYTEIPAELGALDAERQSLSARHGRMLDEAAVALRDELGRRAARGLSSVTEHAFVLEGWLPADSEPLLRDTLDRHFHGAVVLESLGREAWRSEDAPVALRNPRLFRPFETITRMLPLPHYGTIDPTPFVAVFFPMFFGLILGDIGYGLALALLALVVHWRSRAGTTLRAVSEVAGACALFAIAFGLAFGEFLGDLGRRWFGLEPLLFDREHELMAFFGLAVAIGVVHIVLGLVLGAVASRRSHPRTAIGHGLSALMVLLISVALLAALGTLPRALMTPAAIAALVAFPVIVILEGIIAPIELLSTFSHILSYARIMALGTASVMLAIVANQMVGAMGSVLVGVLFALLFHLVNFGLGLFSPTIHSLRLHYVEFFGTFYSPGGTKYEPLGHWNSRRERTA